MPDNRGAGYQREKLMIKVELTYDVDCLNIKEAND